MHRGGKSPYELLTGRPPDLTYLHTFGCAVAVFQSKEQRTKAKGLKKLTADHALFGLYMGPSEESPASVIYIPGRNRMLTAAHCLFKDDSFPGTKTDSGTDWNAVLANLLPTSDTNQVPPTEGDHPLLPRAPDDSTQRPAPELLPSPPAIEPSPLAEAQTLLPGPTTLAQDRPPLGAPPKASPPTAAVATADDEQASDESELDGDYWKAAAAHEGRDGRTKRTTPQRNGTFTYGFGAIAKGGSRDGTIPSQLALMALASAARPAFSYLTCVACAALPQPTFDFKDCRIPKGYRQAMQDVRASYWTEAIDREWAGILANDTMQFVPRSQMPPSANLMNSHYVFDLKTRADGSIDKFKARLVADGNTQKFGVDFDQVFATVVKLATIRMILTLAAARDYGLWQLDVRQAFLQATLTEDLYMRMPPNVSSRNAQGEEMVCKLRKTLYGLKQAAREWSTRLTSELVALGCIQGTIDTCLYRLDGSEPGEVCYLLVYVDDLVLAYSSEAIRDKVIRHLTERLPIDDRGELEWVLRLQVTRDREARAITISQRQYIDQLLENHMAGAEVTKKYESPMDDRLELTGDDSPTVGTPAHADFAAKRQEYMTVIGSLLWLAACTRPDLSYTVSTLARYVGNPGPSHYKAMQRALAYLQTTRHWVLRMAPVAGMEHPLEIYSDASWTSDNSITGGAIFYMGVLLAWWTRRQKSVSSSSAQAEYFAAATASREGVYFRDLLEDAGLPLKGPTPLLLDSKSAIDLAYDPVAFKKTKHIMRAAAELRDRVAREMFTPTYVEAAGQVADIMTKGLGPTAHKMQLVRLLSEDPP